MCENHNMTQALEWPQIGARESPADAPSRDPVGIVDRLSMVECTGIDFVPERLGLTARTPEL